MRKLFLLCSPFFVVFIFLFSLSFYSGCARKGEEEITGTPTPAPTKTLLEFKLTVVGGISNANFDESYVIALDTDGDFSNGPYVTISETTGRFSNFQTGFQYGADGFRRIQLSEGVIGTTTASPASYTISGNTLTVAWDPKEFGSPAKIDVNVFTKKQIVNDITIIDGLGDPVADRDAKVIHMDLNNETEKSATDAVDDVAQENSNFNITALSVKKITF